MTGVIDSARSALSARLRQRLIGEASPAGGWAYYAGKRPRIEATAWALLALADTSDLGPAAWQLFAAPHLAFLAQCQQPDGLMVDSPGMFPNVTSNAIAACVLTHLSDGASPVLTPLLNGLLTIKGVKLDVDNGQQNNQLQGWPWMVTTFSWVEPTAWCILALKTARMKGRLGDARIKEAELLLANRSCAIGGWNFGNASVLGQDLRPYVPTSALGLIALQDRRDDSVVSRGLAYVDGARLNERSAMALSLVALCLRIYGKPVDDVEQRLAEDVDRIDRIGNFHTMAMALYALEADRHQIKALRV